MENTDYLMNTPNISHPALKLLVERDPHLLLDEKGTPEIKHITEKLELELGESLKGQRVSLSDIKGVKSRFILLIGSDDYLLEAVGAYIYCLYCIKGGTSIFYHSFRGKSDDCLAKVLTAKYIFMNDTTIRQWTSARDIIENERLIGHGLRCKNVSSTGYPKTMDGDLLEHIRQGRSVFLSDLKYPNSLLLESIGKRIKGIVTHWETYEVDKRGLLITSAESEKDLPGYFVKQFEKIDLRHGEKDRLQTGCLTFNGKEIQLQNQQIKLLNALQTPTRVENILNSVFGCDYKIDAKLNPFDRNNFDKAKSKFNTLCKKGFKIRDDIIKNYGLKTFGINEKYTGKINLT